MKYMLLIYGNEQEWESMSREAMEHIYADHMKYWEAMEKAGVLRSGSELKPTTTATSLRFTAGKAVIVDGPFAETKEQLGGYYLIEVDDLEQAISWAGKMPGMTGGTVEIRPLNDMA